MMDQEYRTALRGFMERKGRPVAINQDDRTSYPDDPDMWVSFYGWVDHQADEHGRSCGWRVDAGVSLTEVSYSEFTDTDSPNQVTVGINVEPVAPATIRCACGDVEGVTLRWEGSIMETIQEIFGMRGQGKIIL